MGNTSSDCVHYLQNQQLMNLAKGDGDCAQLQELLFHFGGTYTDDSHLQTGALLGGTAGQIEITGDHNKFVQGSSTATSTAGLQELLFHFGGTYADDSHLQTGALLGGTAGQIEITGDHNKFVQGSSTSKATAKILMVI